MTVQPAFTREEKLAIRECMKAEAQWRTQAATLDWGPPDENMARLHLIEFIRLLHPWYLVGWYHRELAWALEAFSRDVAAKRSPRLMISAPPRIGKSQLVSRDFPCWHLGRNPGHEFVLASYVQDLANDMSRDARAVRDQALRVFPGLAPGDKDGVEQWRTKDGGTFFAVGVGGPLTGRGADIICLDDLLKGWREAKSTTVRNHTWEWYASVAMTRLSPGGGILMMATRWSTDDPPGRMLKQKEQEIEDWRVISYPAIAIEDEPFRKKGEALHPERYPIADLEHTKAATPPQMWEALYQQRPSADKGGTFERAWLTKRFIHDPQRPPSPYTEILVSVDATFDEADTSDFVSMIVWGRRGWTEYHVLDRIYDQMDFVASRAVLRDLVRKWSPATILIERGANGFALISELKKEFPGVLGFTPAEYGSKETRAVLSTSYFAAGNVFFPQAKWTGDLVENLALYPAGEHDDDVDACAQAIIHWQKKQAKGTDDRALTANLQDLAKSFGY